MDASFFKFWGQELRSQVLGLRLGKVFAPLRQCWTFALGRAGFLVVHIGKAQPFVFLTKNKPENPPRPSGQAMWLRKRLQHRKILDQVLDWPQRRWAWKLSPGQGSWLIIGLQEPPTLVPTLPSDFGASPVWPTLETIISQPQLWKTHPHLTSPLRYFLSSLSPLEAQDFLSQLQQGSFNSFYTGRDHRGRLQVALWPLNQGQNFLSALEASTHWGHQLLAELIKTRAGQDRAQSKAQKRLQRILQRLDEDQARLQALIQGREDARALQNILYKVDKHSHVAEIEIKDTAGHEKKLKLDPALSIVHNMNRIFARASKGERGLPLVAARRAALEKELQALSVQLPAPASAPKAGPKARRQDQGLPAKIPARYQGIKVASFRSSDGFFIFRGRSAQANHQLLTKAASPFDFWLHAQDGPGAHVIVKRDFPTQQVPLKTLEEAAVLAALASHWRMADQGRVLVALVRDVRTIKGAAQGMVDVTKVLQVLRVNLDPDLEQTLQI